jgi:hypothetical protein
MADITTSYVYNDGQTLNPDGHNQNIYDAEYPASNGIMSTVNGGLDAINLDSQFAVYPEHIQMEQQSISAQEGTRVRVDAFADAFATGQGSGEYGVLTTNTDSAKGPITEPAPLSKWFPVPGCGIRVYVPYDVSVALWQWSFFFHPARLSMVSQDSTAASDECINLKEVCEIGLAAMLDGALVEHSRRQTKVFAVSKEAEVFGGFLTSGSAKGGRTAEWWDMAHMETDVSAGWHDIQLMIYMERFARENYIHDLTLIRNGEYLSYESAVSLGGRATFGIRNARVLTLL